MKSSLPASAGIWRTNAGSCPGPSGVYEDAVRVFVSELDPELHLDALDAAQVVDFIVGQARLRSAASAGNLVVGLRSFLRFAFSQGLIDARLDLSVPTVATWRASALPRSLEPGLAERLVDSCDRTSTTGRKDCAILLCLWRLGLRGGEVAALCLDDIDWRAGELVVHSKGGRDERLPLPNDVGEAIAGYLRRGRPRHPSRALFLRSHAPLGPCTTGSVRWAVYRACDRVGVPRFGSHRLRHTTAADLLRQGASLEDVAQMLRHRNIDTTAIYAKIDLGALMTIARPWPGGAA